MATLSNRRAALHLERLESREVPAATLRLAVTDPTAPETATGIAHYTVTRTNDNLAQPLTVRYSTGGNAVNGTDYNALSGQAVIPAGKSSVRIDVRPKLDVLDEPDETVVVSLVNSSAYAVAARTGTTRILDDDLPVVRVVATDDLATEAGRTTATLTFSRTLGDLSRPLSVRYTVGGSATAGADYGSLSGVATIPAGQSSVRVTVTPADDSTVEPREWINVRITDNAAYRVATRTAAISIEDNDVADPLPVLLVIANRDFFYREYAEPRRALMEAGFEVKVAAGIRQSSNPHANTGETPGNGAVVPDLSLAEVDSADYSAIVFVGGWGASSYQYAFGGTYSNAVYNGSPAVEARANELINEFVAQDKYVVGICHGVSVLAWARIGAEGRSLLADRTAVAPPGLGPNFIDADGIFRNGTGYDTRWHASTNGANLVPAYSLGDPNTAADDVIVDGRIITAQDDTSAYLAGQTLAQRLG